MAGELVEETDRWRVSMAGTVTQCRVDHAFSLVVADGQESVELRIGQPFAVVSGGDEVLVDPEGDPVQLVPALRTLHREVAVAVAFKDGRLELKFDDGVILQVSAGEDYEPWDIVGPRGLRIVSTPGGELAIWSPEPKRDG